MKSEIYLPVPFPLSQYFQNEEHIKFIHLINDQKGIDKWGPNAYFVPAWLFFKAFQSHQREFEEYFGSLGEQPELMEVIEFEVPVKGQKNSLGSECQDSGINWLLVPDEKRKN